MHTYIHKTHMCAQGREPYSSTSSLGSSTGIGADNAPRGEGGGEGSGSSGERLGALVKQAEERMRERERERERERDTETSTGVVAADEGGFGEVGLPALEVVYICTHMHTQIYVCRCRYVYVYVYVDTYM